MKDFLQSPILKELCETCSNMYRLGWDERNGGNISYLLYEDEVAEYFDTTKVIRTTPTGFDATYLIGKYVLVTGTGKYFKNVEKDPENNLGLVRIGQDGTTAELIWGFKDGGKFTSEFASHLMSHIERLKVDPLHRVVDHCHPDHILAMTYLLPADEIVFTHELWQMETECIIVFPEGVAVLPWMLCGTNEIGEVTAEKMKDHRLVVWCQHGIYGTGRTLDEAFGLIETVEKAAHVFILTYGKQRVNTITDDNLREIVKGFNITNYHKGIID